MAVDLATELLETDVLPTSRDRESDTDLLSPPALAAVEVDVAPARSRSFRLRSRRGSHWHQRQLHPGLASSSVCPERIDPNWGGNAAAFADPIAASLPGRPINLVSGLAWATALRPTEGE